MLTSVDDGRFRGLLIAMSFLDSSASSMSVLQSLYALAALHLYGHKSAIPFKEKAVKSLSMSAQSSLSSMEKMQHIAAQLLLSMYEVQVAKFSIGYSNSDATIIDLPFIEPKRSMDIPYLLCKENGKTSILPGTNLWWRSCHHAWLATIPRRTCQIQCSVLDSEDVWPGRMRTRRPDQEEGVIITQEVKGLTIYLCSILWANFGRSWARQGVQQKFWKQSPGCVIMSSIPVTQRSIQWNTSKHSID